MKQILTELKRSNIISGSRRPPGGDYKNQSKGVNRFQRRTHSHFANSVREFNNIDMNKLFGKGILDLSINIRGETDNYVVKISFGGFLDKLHDEISRKGVLNLITIVRALKKAFDTEDVYVHCTCKDWKFRFGYWALLDDLNSDTVGDGQTYSGLPGGPEPDITNPDDNKGFACKHVLLVLNNTIWLNSVASVINNYINYIEKHQNKLYKDIIYPAIYGEAYVEPEDDDLPSDSDIIDTSNKWAREKNRFKPGNTSGVRFSKEEPQVDIDNL